MFSFLDFSINLVRSAQGKSILYISPDKKLIYWRYKIRHIIADANVLLQSLSCLDLGEMFIFSCLHEIFTHTSIKYLTQELRILMKPVSCVNILHTEHFNIEGVMC
jgi:hypothetical protein